MTPKRIAARLLDVLEFEILPMTTEAVKVGNKLFGAAILKKSDLSLVVAGTNRETENPLFHGEISTLNTFWGLPAQARPAPEQCIFFSTHEPCPLCLSAITWSGFDNFYYFFSYEDSRDAFAIPHDLNILNEVFHCPDGQYNPENAYWRSYWLMDLIEATSTDRVARLRSRYDALSLTYQENKARQEIPLA